MASSKAVDVGHKARGSIRAIFVNPSAGKATAATNDRGMGRDSSEPPTLRLLRGQGAGKGQGADKGLGADKGQGADKGLGADKAKALPLEDTIDVSSGELELLSLPPPPLAASKEPVQAPAPIEEPVQAEWIQTDRSFLTVVGASCSMLLVAAITIFATSSVGESPAVERAANASAPHVEVQAEATVATPAVAQAPSTGPAAKAAAQAPSAEPAAKQVTAPVTSSKRAPSMRARRQANASKLRKRTHAPARTLATNTTSSKQKRRTSLR